MRCRPKDTGPFSRCVFADIAVDISITTTASRSGAHAGICIGIPIGTCASGTDVPIRTALPLTTKRRVLRVQADQSHHNKRRKPKKKGGKKGPMHEPCAAAVGRCLFFPAVASCARPKKSRRVDSPCPHPFVDLHGLAFFFTFWRVAFVVCCQKGAGLVSRPEQTAFFL
nr:hypothetical protein [Pandoravirus massiliensis]